MTVRNGEPYVREAVQSILTQTYTEFEFLVVDNGSTDDSLGIIRSFHDPRIRMIVLKRNIGRPQALNLALGEARGDYVAVQDADDVSFPTRFEAQMSYLTEHPDVALLGTWCQVIDENGKVSGEFLPPTGTAELSESLASYDPFAHSSVMYRRDIAQEARGYPPDYHYSHDFYLWFRLSRCYSTANLPEKLVQLRVHAAQEGRDPALKLARKWDLVRIHRLAVSCPNAPRRFRTRARQALVGTSSEYAELLRKDGRWMEALGWAAWLAMRHPFLCCRDVHIRARLARVILGDARHKLLLSAVRRRARAGPRV
jgi:glycosyltransferase involved in cell wall biosynthesis